PRTREVDDEAGCREEHSRREDPEERRPDTARSRRRADRREEREARAEVARQAVARDEQEQHGADRGEEQGRGDGEARDDRHEDRRAEHREHVLGAKTDRARPAEPLARAHDLARSDDLAVTVTLPTDETEPLAQARRARSLTHGDSFTRAVEPTSARARSNTSDDDGTPWAGSHRATRVERRKPSADDGEEATGSPRCGRSGWHHAGVTSPVSASAPAPTTAPHESPRPPRWWGRALIMAVAAVFLGIFAWYAGGALLGLFASIVIAFFLALAFEPSVLWLV